MRHANVALFIPHNGCPHQCSFCDQRSITGRREQPGASNVIRAAEAALQNGCCKQEAEIAFFGGSFTAVEPGYMKELLTAASAYVGEGKFAGIRISTRPDAVDEEILDTLQRYGVRTIELGAQSMDDRVLQCNRRGHTAEQIADASRRILRRGFSLGLQMMTGLYGDTPTGAEETARRLAALKPGFMRIYPAIVLRGTALAELYEGGAYRPMELDETVSLCAALLDYLEERRIPVIRLGLHASPELEAKRVAGPWHPAFGELCKSALFLRRLLAALQAHNIEPGSLTVFISPRDLSQAQGQKKKNISTLAEYGYTITFVRLNSMLDGTFRFFDKALDRNVTYHW